MAGTPVAVAGDITTDQVLLARRVVDMAPMIIQLEETDKAPFTTFLDSLGVRPVYNHQFHWLTDERPPKTHTLGAGTVGIVGAVAAYTADVVDLSGLSTETYVRVNDILKSPDTGEIMKVTDTSGGMAAIDVLRNLDGLATVFAYAAGDQITRISNAVEENSTLRLGFTPDTLNAVTTKVTDNYNYTQTLRDPVGMSRRQMDAKLYGGDDRPYQRAKKLIDHAEQVENTLWHSVRVSNATPGSNDTVTGGMIDAIQNEVATPGSNTFAVGGVLSEDDFNAFMRVFSRYGNSSRKKFFSSRFVCEVVSNFLRAGGTTYRLSGEIGKNGRTGGSGQTTAYASGVGFTADIVPTRALEGIPGSRVGLTGGPVAGEWDGIGVLVDPENVRLAKYGDCYMQLEVDVQLPDQDGVVDSYKSDIGLQWGNPNHHALMTGITG
jgi:hypothetical protein